MSLALGTACPAFDLPGTDGKKHSLESLSDGKALVVIVSCNHCPYVVAYEERMVKLSREYRPKGVRFCAINANDVSRYPEDSMEAMKTRAKERGFDFPYLRDDSQATTRALGARFTPEVFVFANGQLRYHGRIDDNHRSERDVRAHDLRNALDALLSGNEPPVTETSAVGCSIKWRAS
jgi:thiol-disulfide isomerase/thioredoxin